MLRGCTIKSCYAACSVFKAQARIRAGKRKVLGKICGAGTTRRCIAGGGAVWLLAMEPDRSRFPLQLVVRPLMALCGVAGLRLGLFLVFTSAVAGADVLVLRR